MMMMMMHIFSAIKFKYVAYQLPRHLAAILCAIDLTEVQLIFFFVDCGHLAPDHLATSSAHA